MSTQTIRYAVGQIAFLMKGPRGETLYIPERHFGEPCVIGERGVIRMLSDDSEWFISTRKHLMLAFPQVGDKVRHGAGVLTVGRIDYGDMTGDPRPLRLHDDRWDYSWPRFDTIRLLSSEHGPDMALLPEEGAEEDKPPLVFKVGDKVQTPDGEVGEVRVVDADDLILPYAVRVSDMVHRWCRAADLTPYESPKKHMLTVEFDSADDLAIAQGIIGNLYVHGAMDEADFPALTRVIERLSAASGSSEATQVASLAVGIVPVHVIAGYHEKDGKLCEKA